MLQTKKIQYFQNDTLLEGYLAYQDDDRPKPAILVVHDWTGRNDFACHKAERLAELGYVGFAIDMYGKGKRGKDNTEKAALMNPLMENRDLLLQRILAAFETVKQFDFVNPAKIGAIGFCFGGLCTLDLARANVEVRGVVSFHGALTAPSSETPPTRTKMLVLHGHDDPMVPPSQVKTFEDEMSSIKADWQIYIYSNTKHAFTNPEAHDESFGTVYQPITDKRSWIAMKNFFEEIFG